MHGGPDGAVLAGSGEKRVQDTLGFRAPVLVETTLDVLFQDHEGGVADAGVAHPLDDLEGSGQGFLIRHGHGPVVEDVIGDAPGAYDGEGQAELAFEGFQSVAYADEGHWVHFLVQTDVQSGAKNFAFPAILGHLRPLAAILGLYRGVRWRGGGNFLFPGHWGYFWPFGNKLENSALDCFNGRTDVQLPRDQCDRVFPGLARSDCQWSADWDGIWVAGAGLLWRT